ncbi:MAG TPA: VC0807 family protein [Ktedonosporobacter sp.]|nr:VC0807 family protein [Ktedonosporobacter sp.]
MSSTQTNSQLSAQVPSFRTTILGLLPSIVINGALPYIIYQLLKSYTHVSDLNALIISAVPAIIGGIVGLIRQRRFDLIACVTITGIAVSIVAAFIGGDPRLFLIRESFLTAATGLAYLISLLFPKPLWFYIIRYFAGANNHERMTAFDANWQNAGFRTFTRVLTLIWGIAFLGEFTIRVILVYSMPIAQFLIISPIIFNGITIAVIATPFLYAKWFRRKYEERRRQMAAAEAQPAEIAETEGI